MECAFLLKRMGCAQGRKNMISKYTRNYKELKTTDFAEFGSG